jgi:hypothetical protein
MPIVAAMIFIVVAALSWREGASIAYVFAAFFGLGALFYTIGNGFRDEAPYAWALASGFLVVGLIRGRIPN